MGGMRTEVHDNPASGRYELYVDGDRAGFADYEVRGDVAVFPHTVIDRDRRGQGLGEILVRGALDDVRRRGLRVIPACWFVASFIDEHPGYEDLRAA